MHGTIYLAFNVMRPASDHDMEKEWSWERDRGDGGDASSRDGDDEDDEDSESEKERTPKASAPGTPAVSNGKSKSKPKSPPSGSISSSASESPVTALVDTGLPATTTPAQTSTPTPTPIAQFSRSSNPPLKGFELYLSEKRKAQGALDGPKDIRERLALPIGRSTAPIYAPGDEAEMPVLLQIPMSDEPKITGDVGSALPALAEPSFESSRPRRVSSTAIPFSVVATLGSTLQIPSHTRNDSDSSDGELTDDESPTGSTGPSSPYEYDPGSAPAPMRTWDDARSVDAFKRDSHEALARFLKKGSPGGSSPQNA
ncbi:unnamed protein product [Rhizoctonia solani]|uniref:Uncharacterized protein n=1 Tax=Rhizoctonia solani TaxID=456999 RepID=A0A8H3D1Q9_9AGAM|nr:unnamed protein product [Rhizoctonia solani]